MDHIQILDDLLTVMTRRKMCGMKLCAHGGCEIPKTTVERLNDNREVETSKSLAKKFGFCCCDEQRNFNGGCDNCGDPCL